MFNQFLVTNGYQQEAMTLLKVIFIETINKLTI